MAREAGQGGDPEITGRLSILIPVYNLADWIGQAIESAMAVEGSPEIVVVDDGSTDGTFDVASRYDINVLRVSHRGVPGALNAGLMNSSEEFVMMLGADDLIAPTYWKHLRPHFDDWSVGVVQPWITIEESGEQQMWRPQPVRDVQDLTGADNVVVAFAAVRREALLRCGGWNTTMQEGWEDWDIWIDLAKRGWRFATAMKPPQVTWRVRPEGITRSLQGYRRHANRARLKANHPEVFVG